MKYLITLIFFGTLLTSSRAQVVGKFGGGDASGFTSAVLFGAPFDIEEKDEKKPTVVIQKAFLYPNPTRNTIHFNQDSASTDMGIQIYHSAGKLMFRSSQTPASLSVLNWPSGLYFVIADERWVRFVKE